MARLALVLALACAALVAPAAANAKEFVNLVLVGARGDSVTLRPPSEAIDRLYRNTSPRVPARGPFIKLYPLGRGGSPAMPGRFYVQSGAVCMGWNALASTRCIPLAASWRGSATRLRPVRFCLSRQGIHACGRLYPLGSAVWAISGAHLR